MVTHRLSAIAKAPTAKAPAAKSFPNRATRINCLTDRDKCMLSLMTDEDWKNLMNTNASMKMKPNEGMSNGCQTMKTSFFAIKLQRVRGLDGPAFSKKFADHALYSKWTEQKKECDVMQAANGRAAAELLLVFRTLQGALDIVSQHNPTQIAVARNVWGGSARTGRTTSGWLSGWLSGSAERCAAC